MQQGMCVVRDADEFCGATLFHASNAQHFLTARVAIVNGALLDRVFAGAEEVVDLSGGMIDGLSCTSTASLR